MSIEKYRADQISKTIQYIMEIFEIGNDISITLIQRRCKCGYYSASGAFQELVSKGIIERGENLNGVSKFVGNKTKEFNE